MNQSMTIAGIDPAIIKKFTAKPGATDADKSAGAAATAKAGILSQWINVTPDMARRWLKANFRNRPVKDDVVAAYARDMVNGVWQPTHQGIAFNDHDELIDGQHRLLGVVKADKTVRMMVTFNLPAKIEGSQMTTMDCVDRGATRSVADQLKIQHGLKNGSQIAQVCSTLAHLCVGERMRRLSVGQTLDIYREFKAGVDFVIANRSKATGLKSAGVLGAFAFAYSLNGKPVGEMFNHLNSGDVLNETSSLKKLREFLTGENASLILTSMNRGIAELTVWAIWQDMNHVACVELAKEPADWFKAVEHFRNLQRERVEKVAKIFKLPVAAKVEPVAEEKSAAPGTPAQPQPAADIPVNKFPPMGKARPTLEQIFSKVESHFKISRFIITGRGSDPDIDAARIVFVHFALESGHKEEAVAAVLKKSVDVVRNLFKPLSAMTLKQRRGVEAIKSKL